MKPSAKIASVIKRYRFKDGLLFFIDDPLHRLCIPDSGGIIELLLDEMHASPLYGHQGVAKTFEHLRKSFFWPRMFRKIKSFVLSCPDCQRNKPSNQKPIGLAQPLDIPLKPWQSVSLDFIVQLPLTPRGHDSILVVVDRLSKIADFIPTVTTVSAIDSARLFFDEIVRLHGVPTSLMSDRDPKFASKFWRALFRLTGTKLNISSSYHPQTDGQTERTNRTLEQILRNYISFSQKDWDLHLSATEFSYNNAQQQSTGLSPFFVNQGYDPFLPASLLSTLPNSENPASNSFYLLLLIESAWLGTTSTLPKKNNAERQTMTVDNTSFLLVMRYY